MGGGNFWELLKPCARKEGFDFLRNKRVAVDLSFWIVQHRNVIKTHVRKPHLRLTFFRTINLFSKFGAFPVFVVDGTPSPLKSQARIARFFQSSGIELTSLPVPEEGVSAERNSLFSSCVQECVELLELLGMPVLKAKGEAEALCAQLNSEGHVDACITADSDAFLYGATCIVKFICPNSKEPFECYSMSDIEAGLGLKRKQLIAISLLVGNDHDMNGVRGIGIDTALHFVQAFSEDDILNRLHEIGKGNALQFPISIKSGDSWDIDKNSPNTKQPHCSFCGHPGNKRDHMKLSCEYCVTDDNEGCLRKPEGFKCDCFTCVVNRKHKEQQRLENWQTKICHKIAEEPNFPKDEIIDMYLCNDNGFFSENNGPKILWERPSVDTLVDFLTFHQRWEPSYIRRLMFPMMSTIFLRNMATATEESLLFGQFEFDSLERVKMRYGHQLYMVKWKRAMGNIASKIPSKESSTQQDVREVDESETVDRLADCDVPDIREDESGTQQNVKEVDGRDMMDLLDSCDVPETCADEPGTHLDVREVDGSEIMDLLDNCDVPEICKDGPGTQLNVREVDESEMGDLLDDNDVPECCEDDGCSFLLTDENMDLVEAAFPAEVKRFWQFQELKGVKGRKNSTSGSQENKKPTSPNLRSIQLNITKFYPSTKIKHQSKKGEGSSKNVDNQGNGGSKMKRKSSSPNLSKSVRRRLLFD